MEIYGNLMNRISECSSSPLPNIGDGATITSYSDRHPGTVISIEKKGQFTIIKVQQDDAKRIDKNGYSESQEYVYTRNTEALISTFKAKYDKDGKQLTRLRPVWVNPETNRYVYKDGGGVYFGHREKYHDFSF